MMTTQTGINADRMILHIFCSSTGGTCEGVQHLADEILARSGQHLDLRIHDTDKGSSIADQYGLTGYPAFVLIKNNSVLWKGSGLMPAHVLLAIFTQHLF